MLKLRGLNKRGHQTFKFFFFLQTVQGLRNGRTRKHMPQCALDHLLQLVFGKIKVLVSVLVSKGRDIKREKYAKNCHETGALTEHHIHCSVTSAASHKVTTSHVRSQQMTQQLMPHCFLCPCDSWEFFSHSLPMSQPVKTTPKTLYEEQLKYTEAYLLQFCCS